MATSHGRALSLDPSIPPFEPNDRELACHSGHTSPDPRALPSSNNDMIQLILQSHSLWAREMVSLERRSEVIADDINSVTNVFRSDMQKLQSMIFHLQTQINNRDEKHTVNSNTLSTDEHDHHVMALIDAFKANGNIAPSSTLKILAGNKENLAEAYLDQAEDAEKFAAKLREHAHLLLGDVVTSSTPNLVRSIGDLSTIQNVKSQGASIPANSIAENGDGKQGNKILQKKTNQEGEDAAWVPRVVREMPHYTGTIPTAAESFAWEFLISQLGGEKYSPGFYFIDNDSIVKSKSYWILEADWEPFLPGAPGGNGAKLTVYFNDTVPASGDAPAEENYLNTPVFIRPKGKEEYLYFGQYSQKRFSDKLDYDRVTVTVPKHVRECQAEQLADKCRPEWVTLALMQNFWPKPTYDGPLPKDSDDRKAKSKVSEALWEYAENLNEWESDARMKANLLTASTLMKAFENADADAEPGLRMYWEYMQCVAYDQEFYDMLVQRKRDARPAQDSNVAKGGVAVGGNRSGQHGKEDEKPAPKSGPIPQEPKAMREKKSGVQVVGDADPARRFREFAQLNKPNGDSSKTRRH